MKRKFFFFLVFILFLFSAFSPGDLTDLIIDGKPCGPHGTAKQGRKEYEQNVFKNRFDIPNESDFITSISLEKMVNAKDGESGFSQNKAVEIEGYVYDVKPGGNETCNCNTTKILFRDTHIEITPNEDETGPESRVIVEVTPRLRKMMEDEGVDWTTGTLTQTLEKKFIRVRGWLFYDFSHKNECFADDPQNKIGKKNWRASCWEVHPVTSIEIMEGDNVSAIDEITEHPSSAITDEDNTSPPSKKSNDSIKTTSMATNTPVNMLVIILLGAILGMVGQGLRVIVGLKKLNETAKEKNLAFDDVFKTRELVMSLFIAFAIGAIAGVLAAVSKVNTTLTQSEVFAFLAAGYAGTDFIEGFMKKNGQNLK